jgi:hypothetical protein
MAGRPSAVPEPSVWRIVARELPRVIRRCPRCDAPRPFVSSGRFRVNAQKRRLDVWLVHRCSVCHDTWNAEVAERQTPEALGNALARYLEDDEALARASAFAVPGADRAVAFTVERPPLGPMPVAVRLALADPLLLRLDRLLAGELAVTRAQIARWAGDGFILADVRRRVHHGQELIVALPATPRPPK